MSFILNWIDLIWLPIGLVALRKQHRAWGAAFFIACMIMMRLQVELIQSTGFENGFTGFVQMDVHVRGQIVYTLFYILYIVLAVYSPGTKGTIFMAATLSLFFGAMLTSMVVMSI